MSRMREVIAGLSPSATVWKASKHRLIGGPLAPDFIEATPDARWARSDPFRTYHPVDDLGRSSEPSPHQVLAKLADMVLQFEPSDDEPSDKEKRVFHMAVQQFVTCY